MRTIERNGEIKLKQKLPTPASRDNDMKTNVVVDVTFDGIGKQQSPCGFESHPHCQCSSSYIYRTLSKFI